MPINTPKIEAQKLTISLPGKLAERFKARVPRRRRSEFIAQLLENQLAIEEQLNALDETAGSWADENHPEMQSDDDIDTWLVNLRSGWNRDEAG